MGNSAPVAPRAPPGLVYPPQNNKTRICVEGFKVSHNTGRAQMIAALIQRTFPDQYDTWFLWQWGDGHYAYHALLNHEWGLQEGHRLFTHKSSPICWLEFDHAVEGATASPGGRQGVWVM